MSVTHTQYCKNYCDFVTKLASKYSMATFETKLGTAGLGLAGEAGEIANLVSQLRPGIRKMPDELRQKVIDELSDIVWYVAFASTNVVKFPFEHLYDEVEPTPHSDSSFCLKEGYVQLMAGCGGFADVVKKLLFHGKPYTDEIQSDLIKKLKHIMANVVTLARDVGKVGMQDVIDHNIKKLSERYKTLEFTTAEFLKKEETKIE